MRIRTLEELRTADERTRRFGGFGLLTDGMLTPEDAAAFQQRTIAQADLCDAVPDMVRDSFERLRELHAYGVLFYDAFTLTSELRWVTLEMALRERFMAYYPGGIPLVNRAGQSDTLRTTSFFELSKALRAGGSHGRGWKLVPHSGGEPIRVPLTMAPLLRWARGEALLVGQRNRYLEEHLFPDMRNHFAHGTAFSIGMPNRSAQGITDLAEIINRLWGVTTPGGRLYPGLTEREVIVIGWSPASSDGPWSDHSLEVMRAEQLTYGQQQNGDWLYIVVRGVWDDPNLRQFDAAFEMTTFPCDLLWGSGTRSDALRWLTEVSPSGDAVDCLDRLFGIRCDGGKVFLPRKPDVIAGLEAEERAGHWLLLQADSPFEAFHHARHLSEGTRCVGDERCAIEEVAAGSWSDLVAAASLGRSRVVPATPSRVRVPRRHPYPDTVGAE